jgi:hypothetical protein
MLFFAVFVWDEDDMAAVDAALRDGTILVGTRSKTTLRLCLYLFTFVLFPMLLCFRHWLRYVKYIKKSVRRDPATIVRVGHELGTRVRALGGPLERLHPGEGRI